MPHGQRSTRPSCERSSPRNESASAVAGFKLDKKTSQMKNTRQRYSETKNRVKQHPPELVTAERHRDHSHVQHPNPLYCVANQPIEYGTHENQAPDRRR